MTRQRISDSGYLPLLLPARGRHFDVFGVGGAVQGAASIASAGIQASAAEHAADLASQAQANSLDFTKNVWNTQQTNAAPYLQTGQTALGLLATGFQPGGQFTQGFDPTAAGLPAQFNGGPAFSWDPSQVQNDPAYQFRLQQGSQALERSAAARGQVLGGGTLKALADYTSGTSAQYENQDYNQALGSYETNYQNAANAYQQNYANAFQTFNSNQGNQFNRLSSLAGMGQTANNQLSGAGSAAASNFGQISTTGANNAGNFLTQGGSAVGAGVLGAGNAIANYGLAQMNPYNPNAPNGYGSAYVGAPYGENTPQPYVPPPDDPGAV